MSIAHSILQNYRLTDVGEVEYLGGAGGFSGAQIWKVQAATHSYCLRRWPESHPDSGQLDWINLVLVHVAANGCPNVATPLATIQGDRYVQKNGFLWELAPWMKGQASFEHDPNDAKLDDAMKCLAQFHLASAQVNLDFRHSRAAQARYASLSSAEPLIRQIRDAKPSGPLRSVPELRGRVLDRSIGQIPHWMAQLQPFVNTVLPVQPVIRDIWHDHVLFTGDQVTGLIDFGAMQMDNVAVDLARLLGSLVGDRQDRWDRAINQYTHLRPLNELELRFAHSLDQCANLLSALNWLKWILIERRNFESWDNVDDRIQRLIARMSERDLEL